MSARHARREASIARIARAREFELATRRQSMAQGRAQQISRPY